MKFSRSSKKQEFMIETLIAEFVQNRRQSPASAALPSHNFAARKKSVLVFTKSSGWEHDVVKRVDGKLSIVEQAITSLGNKQGFNVTATKDGGVFDSNRFPEICRRYFLHYRRSDHCRHRQKSTDVSARQAVFAQRHS